MMSRFCRSIDKVFDFGERVGAEMVLPLDVELVRPGEGEVMAAKRLLERVIEPYGRFFDGIVVDALYLEAPFFNLCLDHGKPLIAVIKGEQRAWLQEAQGLFAQMAPGLGEEPQRLTRFWDAEGFTSAEEITVPLRVLHAHETLSPRKRIARQGRETLEEHHWSWATTLPLSQFPSRHLWRIGHTRWDIENDLFNPLTTHWSLDHCFKHDPPAILNFILTLSIAFILLQSFYFRNLKPPCRARLTLIGLASELPLGLLLMISRAPWLDRGG